MAAPVSEQYAERIRAVPETALRDHFNGNLRVLDTGYFASIRKLDGFWLLVMLPQAGIGSRYLVPVGIAAAATLLFAILLILCACRNRGERIGTETGIPAAEQEADNPGPPIGEDADQKEKHDEVLAMLGSFIYREKPYFEERWPEDFTPWTNRSTGSRFMTVLRCILIALLGAILIHTITAGENSVWYYCFSGEWERGIKSFTDNGYVISLSFFCPGKYFGWLNRQLNRELKSMCDRRGIRLALPQVVIHGAASLPEEKKTEQ